jgi:putative transposase
MGAGQAPNHLNRCFDQDGPDRAWTSDITYIPTQEGFLFLAVVMDVFSRRIVGWSMADHLEASLVIDAMEMALAWHSPSAGILARSDRGVQYACDAYQKLLQDHQAICSMSGKGNCYDNAITESFFGTLKTGAGIMNSTPLGKRPGGRSSSTSKCSTIGNGDIRR